METLEFVVELHKTEEKGKVMENSYAMFQIIETVGRSQIFFYRKNPVLESVFDKVAGLKRSATFLKRDSTIMDKIYEKDSSFHVK